MSLTEPRTERPPLPKYLADSPRLSRWLTIRADGTAEVRSGKVELGQGIATVLAQVAAEELGIPLDQVRVLPANTRTGPHLGLTSGSMSVQDSMPALRLVTRQVRQLFLERAARDWSVAVEELRLTEGRISHPGSGRSTGYADLAHAVDLDVDADPDIELTPPPEQGAVIGRSIPRIDLRGKVTGRPSYIHDLRLPGQLFGRVVRPPSRRARLLECTVELPEDVTLVRDGSFVGVLAPSEALADNAVELLRAGCGWEESAELPDHDRLPDFLRSGPHETIPVVEEELADTPGTTLRASYHRGFLAHASIAPSCAVAQWDTEGRLAVWTHSQGIHRLRDAIAQVLGLDADRITVEHRDGAGCYGHNPADDAAFDAVLLARAVPGRPVQVRWSRRDELAWDPFGSAMTVDLVGTLDEAGRIVSWSCDVFSQGHTSRPGYAGQAGLLAAEDLAEPWRFPAAVDPPLRGGAGTVRNADPIYQVGRRRVVGHRLLSSPVRSSALRALGAFANVFAIESFMDELAAAAGTDPLAFRLDCLDDPRARAVLEAAAADAGWGRSTPDDVGLGLGLARYKGKGAYCAAVAEVAAEAEVRVRRLWLAVDVGYVVNPDGLRNQIEGGAIQATSWAVKEQVRFDGGRVSSDDWESYPILRFTEVPAVDVRVLSRPDQPPVGSGEAAQGPTAAAIGNALADALGVRVRRLPLTPASIIQAIESAG